ncbi:MAG: ABC transporter permease subunit [Anaerolineae bacterium]|jgi:putative aldouronate transport system permease protein|nr:ABC transporter permease subunit [Anaerolineae bacterium]
MAIAVEAKRPEKRGLLGRFTLGRRDKVITTTNVLLMCLPAVAMLIVFNYLPMFGLVIAFKDYRFAKGIFGSEWVGLNNFRFIFGGAGSGWRLVWHTVFYNLIFIFSGMVGSLALAFLINEVHTTRASRVYQAMAFLPHFVSWVVVGIFANGFLRFDGGIVNKFLILLGIEPLYFYQRPEYWPYILAAVNLWKGVGFGSITYMAGMLGIDDEFYEAAQIDGANRWQQIRYITVPLLIPLIITVTLLSLGGIFRGNLEMFQMMIGNNPLLYSTTDIIDTFVFRSLLTLGSLGLASAAGFFQSVVGLVMILATNWLVRTVNKERALY